MGFFAHSDHVEDLERIFKDRWKMDEVRVGY